VRYSCARGDGKLEEPETPLSREETIMSDSNHLIHDVEQKNASGPLHCQEANSQPTVELERLRRELADAQTKMTATASERDQLREELTAVQRECDEYRQWIYALMPKDVHLTPEELADLEKNGVPFEQAIAAIEQEARGNCNG
jgi:uncharacterized coiled-coil DUF342 family protein